MLPECTTTTHWRPESSLARESFNDLVRRRRCDVAAVMMRTSTMSRRVMMEPPGVGSRSWGLLQQLPPSPRGRQDPALFAAGLKALDGAPASALSSASGLRPGLRPSGSLDSNPEARRSLSICSSKGDGLGSIRLGTPVMQGRTSKERYPGLLGTLSRSQSTPQIRSSTAQPRSGYMPPEAGRLPKVGTAKLLGASGVQGLSKELVSKIEALFQKMDKDSNGFVTREEARAFFRRFGRLSADAMFCAVDEDRNERISFDEFLYFWGQVKGGGYQEEDLVSELGELLEGGAWVGFHDSEGERSIGVRDTAAS